MNMAFLTHSSVCINLELILLLIIINVYALNTITVSNYLVRLLFIKIDNTNCFVRLHKHKFWLESPYIYSLPFICILIYDVLSDYFTNRDHAKWPLTLKWTWKTLDDLQTADVKYVQFVFTFNTECYFGAIHESNWSNNLFLEELLLN